MDKEDYYKMYEGKVEHIAKLVWNEFSDLTNILNEEPKGLENGLLKYSTFVDTVIIRIINEKAAIVSNAMVMRENKKI